MENATAVGAWAYPREHGGWAMLGLTLLVGGALHGRVDALLLLVATGCLLAFVGQAAWTSRFDLPGARRQALLEGMLSAACFAGAVVVSSSQGRILFAILGCLALVALALRERGRKGRRVALFTWDAHLASAISLGGIAALLAVDETGVRVAVASWILAAAGFGAGILLVRAARDGGAVALVAWIAASSAAAFATAPDVGPALLLSWCAVPARLLLVPFARGASWKTLGWTEAMLGAWSSVWLVLAFG